MTTTFGTRLKELRTERGIYQQDFADFLSISKRQLQRYETDKTDVPLSMLITLADYFEVSVDYLIGRSDSRNGNTTSKSSDN